MKIFVAATEFCRPNKSHNVFFLCDLLQRQNSVAETKILKRSPAHTKRFVAATYGCNWSPDLYTLSDLSPTCRIVCLRHPLSPTRPPEREMGRVGEDPGTEVENTLESV